LIQLIFTWMYSNSNHFIFNSLLIIINSVKNNSCYQITKHTLLMNAIRYLHARNDIFVVSLWYNWWPLLTCMPKWNILCMMHIILTVVFTHSYCEPSTYYFCSSIAMKIYFCLYWRVGWGCKNVIFFVSLFFFF